MLPLCVLQYGRSDSYRVATTQDKDDKESPKKKGGKDLDDLKKEVPIVRTIPTSCDFTAAVAKGRRSEFKNLIELQCRQNKQKRGGKFADAVARPGRGPAFKELPPSCNPVSLFEKETTDVVTSLAAVSQ